MTIQLSVTVWTVICFLLLMLVLNNLLFRPILKLLDERKQRIDSATQKKQEILKLNAEHTALAAEKEKEFFDSEQARIKAKIAEVREAGIKAIETAKKERLQALQDCEALCERQHNEILETLSVHTLDIARLFADSLIEE